MSQNTDITYLAPGTTDLRQIVFAINQALERLQGLKIATGTWTPVLYASVPGDFSISYFYQIGHWVRIGGWVWVTCDLVTSSFTYTTASGQAGLSGLPYNTLGGADFVGKLHAEGIAKAGNTGGYSIVSTGGVNPALVFEGDVPFSTILITDFPSGGTVALRFSIFYPTPDSF